VTEERMLEQLYAAHHRRGARLGRAVLEETRACLFRSWIGQGKDVLDLGCRDGTLTRHLLQGNRVIGADIDADALGAAERAYGMETRQVNLNGPLPFPAERFDVVLLAETLEHLPYPCLTLAEVRRVLRPSGLFIGNVPLFYHLETRWRVLRGKRIDSDPTHLQYLSYDSLRCLLAGFFALEELLSIRGRLARYSMRLFARNVAFRCRKT
jgi:SAM-dependent methyltransferase